MDQAESRRGLWKALSLQLLQSKGMIVVLEEGQDSFTFLGNSFTTSISKFTSRRDCDPANEGPRSLVGANCASGR